MVNESIAIVLVLLATLVTTVKAKKELYAVLVLPVFSVPIFYFISKSVIYIFNIPYGSTQAVEIIFVVAGGLIGSTCSFLLGRYITKTDYRTAYIVLGFIFSLGLMMAYIVNLV